MDEKGFDSINIIPLVDVMLVLLTIVLTTSTFIATGVIPVQLPQASESAKAEHQKVVTISIDAQEQLYLDSLPTTITELRSQLSGREKSAPILIRADRSIALQHFVAVMDLVKGLGFTKVSLQTEAS